MTTGPSGNTSPTNCELRSRLADIGDKIAALELQVALLRTEQDEAMETLDSIVYPVLSLPTDITSEIFLHYMDTLTPTSPREVTIRSSWRAFAAFGGP